MVMSSQFSPPSALHTTIAHVSKPSSSNSHTYTQYVIRVSDERTAGLHWTVYRRFSEFRLFRRRLDDAVKQGDLCGDCSIMSKRTAFMQFPHRRLFGNTNEKVLETRRCGLNAFLHAVATHARHCGESVTCKTRELMDQFLDVNDMRYTYLNVHMSDSEDDFRNKSFLNSTGSTTSSTTSNHLFAATPTAARFRSSSSDYMTNNNNQVEASVDKTTNYNGDEWTSTDPGPSSNNHHHRDSFSNGRVLTAKKTSLPNLLEYGRGSCLGRASLQEKSISAPALVGTSSARLSDWESIKYQTPSAGRHSDPGLAARNDLLNFPQCSSSSSRRLEQRQRPRKLHLSSAAKRVKKLEEQEARFTCRPPAKQKKRTQLATIDE